MRDLILKTISARDAFLLEIHTAFCRNERIEDVKIGCLALANIMVRRYGQLTDGPNIKVLTPEESAHQLQFCEDIEVFLLQIASVEMLLKYTPTHTYRHAS